jgi:hypothetical protein
MTFSSRSRPNGPAILAIVVLHGALYSALLAQRHQVTPEHEGKLLEPVQWLLPLVKPPATEKPAPAVQPRRPVLPPASAAVRAVPAASDAPAATPAVAPAAAPVPPTAPASAPDPFDLANAPTTPITDALLRRQDWGAGKVDHELRGGKLAKLVRPTNTLQAGLERAFQEAGEAVPPKWFSAPEIREISVPESRMRMYKIRTGIGTYCFYKPDPSLQAGYDYKLMACPREK